MEKKIPQSKEKFKDPEDALEEKSFQFTRALIQTFLQTVKSFRLYEANHPILLKFIERLKKDFDNYFAEFDSFPLLVGEHRLFYRGKVVYENQDVKESLAFFFFKDGIREIKFFRGLELSEVISFLHIVRRSESVNRLEDDLVTLLWEKDFPHITFGTVDEFLEEGGHYVPATEEDLSQRLEFKGLDGETTDEVSLEREKRETPSLRVESLKQAINPSPGQSLVEACQLTPEEIKEISREIELEHQPEYIHLLTDNLLEILFHLGEDMDAYENMISFFERTIGSFLEQGEIKKAVDVLKKLNDTLESMVLKDKQIFAIRRILDTFSNAHSIELLGGAMNRNEPEESEATLQYLRLLTPKGIESLCLQLGKVESGKWRKAICDVLAELSREDIKPLVKFLADPNPFVVCHILYILGKIGHPSTIKYLGNLAVHPDAKVREETLQILKKLNGQGKDLLHKFLNDPLPEMRAKASLIFAKVAKEAAAKPLLGIIRSEEFFKRDYEEKSSFFKALGETRAPEVIPVLKEIARKKRWFQKGKWEEMRVCARNTLRMFGAEEGSASFRDKKKFKQIEQSIH